MDRTDIVLGPIEVVDCHTERAVGDVILGGVAVMPEDSLREHSRWIASETGRRAAHARAAGTNIARFTEVSGTASPQIAEATHSAGKGGEMCPHQVSETPSKPAETNENACSSF